MQVLGIINIMTIPLKQLLLISLITSVVAGATLLFTSCVDDYYRHGYHHGNHAAPFGKKLKPKEKAHLGLGPHAGHPHGGPPGQRKKLWGW